MKLFIKNRKGQKVAVVVEQVTPQKGLAFVMHGLGGTKDQPHVQTFADVFIGGGTLQYDLIRRIPLVRVMENTRMRQ